MHTYIHTYVRTYICINYMYMMRQVPAWFGTLVRRIALLHSRPACVGAMRLCSSAAAGRGAVGRYNAVCRIRRACGSLVAHAATSCNIQQHCRATSAPHVQHATCDVQHMQHAAYNSTRHAQWLQPLAHAILQVDLLRRAVFQLHVVHHGWHR